MKEEHAALDQKEYPLNEQGTIALTKEKLLFDQGTVVCLIKEGTCFLIKGDSFFVLITGNQLSLRIKILIFICYSVKQFI